MNTIKKCPFCDHEVRMQEGLIIMFTCSNCGAMVSFDYSIYLHDTELNIAAFNRREVMKND